MLPGFSHAALGGDSKRRYIRDAENVQLSSKNLPLARLIEYEMLAVISGGAVEYSCLQ